MRTRPAAARSRSATVSWPRWAAAGSAPQVGALLAHEIGHLHTRSTRYGVAVAWLSAPWRLVVALLGGMLRGIVGKVPTARAGLVVLGPIILVVAAVQGVQERAWVPLSCTAATTKMIGPSTTSPARAVGTLPTIPRSVSRRAARRQDARALSHATVAVLRVCRCPISWASSVRALAGRGRARPSETVADRDEAGRGSAYALMVAIPRRTYRSRPSQPPMVRDSARAVPPVKRPADRW